ncbi:unnamed protein product [Effrenium voratum]|nr:unnamed protein product [Effrenium voratum]
MCICYVAERVTPRQRSPVAMSVLPGRARGLGQHCLPALGQRSQRRVGLDGVHPMAVGHADGQFSKLDFNNDSRVALRELLWEPLLGASLHESALRQGFLLSDSDHDGQLSGTEMERPPALRLLHLLRHNFWPGAVLDVPQAAVPVHLLGFPS